MNCIDTGCGLPQNISDIAYADPGSTDHLDVITYTCGLGYVSDGQNGKPNRTCQTSGIWGALQNPCYRRCPIPSV